uniref:G-protein coupled receptors family 1 profile domain-containing protein n=2 Tax=Pyxicephalus adspersus TaxID=30357 RepID=A0AAV3B3N3_PYXAD|nr:TPA: hypothetical protein GDO54_005812 [Pyxicephalus adspersus]
MNHLLTLDNNTSSYMEYNISSNNNTISLSSWWLTWFLPWFCVVVFILSLPLNNMAIFIFLVKMKVRKPAVVYMLNLASSDVIYICTWLFRIVYRFLGNNWLIGEGMCRFVMASLYCNKYGSILLMMSISVERFLAIVYPMRSLSWRTVKRAWLVCGIIWIISMASVVPLLINRQTFMLPAQNITTCYDVLDSKVFNGFFFKYFIPYLIIFFILPLIVTTTCYIGTICNLCLPHIGRTLHRSRAIYLTAVVLFVFVISFGPSNILFLIHYLQMFRYRDDSLNFAYILTANLSSIRCCLNPLIYYYASSQLQPYIGTLICCKRKVRNRSIEVALVIP